MSINPLPLIQPIWQWVRRPQLYPNFNDDEGASEFRRMARESTGGMAMYVNVRVVNNGGRTARGCKGLLVGIDHWQCSGWQTTGYPTYQPLAWELGSDDDARQGISIHRGPPAFLNVFSVRQPEHHVGIFPATKPPLVAIPQSLAEPGKFRFTIQITADDHEPIDPIVLEVEWNGTWGTVWDNNGCKRLRVTRRPYHS